MYLGQEVEAILADIPEGPEREKVRAKFREALIQRNGGQGMNNGQKSPTESSGETRNDSTKPESLAPCLACDEKTIEYRQIGYLWSRSAKYCQPCQEIIDSDIAKEDAQKAARAAAWSVQWRQENIENLLRSAGVPEIYLDCSLANFQGLNMRGKERPTFLSGPPGIGKTHLAVGYLREWLLDYGGNGERAAFLAVMDFFNMVKASFKNDSPRSEREIIRHYAEIPFLVLDDLGAEIPTDFAQSVLYHLIDKRYRGLLGPQTIITSNLPLVEFDKLYHPRLASRIASMGPEYVLSGKDRRLRDHTKLALIIGGKGAKKGGDNGGKHD